jgi:glycerol-3-phosphate dehydrogenase (NAD(P)+)
MARSRARRQISDCEHELASHGELTVDGCRRSPTSDPSAHAAKLHFQSQRIAGPHLALEAHAIDSREEGHLAFVFLGAKQRNRTNLGQRLNDQHPRHDRIVREMPLEELLAHRNILDADSPDTVLNLYDAIDEEKRIAMRDNRLYLLRVEHVERVLSFRWPTPLPRESRNEGAGMSISRGSGEAVAVVGAGAWGTTLAAMLADNGHAVTLVVRSESHARELTEQRENERYLPGIAIPASLLVTADVDRAIGGATIVLLVVPSQHMRASVERISTSLRDDCVIVSCAKGLERGTELRMSQVIMQTAGISAERVCALSGPNLAGEIAIGLPASSVVASASMESASRAQAVLGSPRFRVYTSTDVIGVELGGALKNVIALGAGAVDGMRIGHNAKAAFISRGLAEITRLGVAAGAQPLTLGGLSGLGDLIATCESPLSRNRTFGEALGRGLPPHAAAGDSPHVVEGVVTTDVALRLADRYEVEMPIASAVSDVLAERITVREAVERLMARDFRPELDAELRVQSAAIADESS